MDPTDETAQFLQEQLRHPVTGTVVRSLVGLDRPGGTCRRGVFHYTIVTYFLSPVQTGPPVIQATVQRGLHRSRPECPARPDRRARAIRSMAS